MTKRATRPVAPPVTGDTSLLTYTAVLKYNLDQLFDDAHDHNIRTEAPAADAGGVGDICPVSSGGTYKLYVKFRDGWKSVSLT
jgi:hypothetical protein